MPKTKIKEILATSPGVIVTHPEPAHECEKNCCCDYSPHRHDAVWALVMLVLIAFAGTSGFFLIQERDRLESEITAGLLQSQMHKATPTSGPVVPAPKITSTSTALPQEGSTTPLSYLDWIDLTLEYPTGWFAVSQFYTVATNDKVSYVLTMNPRLINLTDRPYSQPPYYLRISRLRSDHRTPERLFEDARALYREVKEENVELEPGLTLYTMSGQKRAGGDYHEYYLVLTQGEGLDRFGDKDAIIYRVEPPNMLEPDENYDTVTKQVEVILRSVRRYK